MTVYLIFDDKKDVIGVFNDKNEAIEQCESENEDYRKIKNIKDLSICYIKEFKVQE